MGHIVLVRHGQASFGAENYDCLSDLGMAQSKRLGEWLAGRGERFTRVVTGPMQRHRQTAQACLAALADAPAVDAWEAHGGLAEYDHEEVLAKHRPDLSNGPAIAAFLESAPDARRVFQQVFAEALRRWTGGRHDTDYRESWPAFRQRCLDALESMADNGAGTTLVFTSGGPISVICQQALDCPDHKAAELSFVLANASVTRLQSRAGRLSLGSFNNFSYLEDGGSHLVTYR
jgi:broad specificity phosphatase PhoE